MFGSNGKTTQFVNRRVSHGRRGEEYPGTVRQGVQRDDAGAPGTPAADSRSVAASRRSVTCCSFGSGWIASVSARFKLS